MEKLSLGCKRSWVGICGLSVFALPGLGRLILVAVEQRDVFLLQGLVMFITTLVILIALLVDIAVMFINPRIRVEMQGE